MSEEFTTIASVNFNQSYGNLTETATAVSSMPDHFESQAKELVNLIQAYYRYLNNKGGPSYEIAKLNSNHDVDYTEDDRYLDAIEKTIALNIPQSRSLDRKRLFKIIANYYTNRGSEDSIYLFFRIFFNEIVSISYPREKLFDTSSDRSKPSDIYRIRDSFRWQEYSYVIETSLGSNQWKLEYLKYIHPAGLKFFSAVVLVFFKDNDWYSKNYLQYLFGNGDINGETINIEDAWNNIDWDEFYGMHSPRFQFGSAIDVERIIAIINSERFHYIRSINPIRGVEADDLNAFWLYLNLSYVTTNLNTRHSNFRNSWRVFEKFIDRGKIGEYADCTINDAEFGSSNYGSGPQFNTLNSHNVKNTFTRSALSFIFYEDISNPNININLWYNKDESIDSFDYEINEPAPFIEQRSDYIINTSTHWKNSFVFSSIIPPNVYSNPSGLEGYYAPGEEVDYYYQP